MLQHLHQSLRFPDSLESLHGLLLLSPVALRHLFGVVHMYNSIDLSNEQDFLDFCNDIDLTPYAGATFEVDSEITGVIEP
jgi:hypothetical protein